LKISKFLGIDGWKQKQRQNGIQWSVKDKHETKKKSQNTNKSTLDVIISAEEESMDEPLRENSRRRKKRSV